MITYTENQTTEVLVIEELTKDSSGMYTCVFDGGEMGECPTKLRTPNPIYHLLYNQMRNNSNPSDK